jgi:uncharacterized RDD family membrane protein YckC/cytoskeletal protein CcmA (bactofilin family)
MKALPSLRSRTARCALAAALLAWSVPVPSLHAQDEAATPAAETPSDTTPASDGESQAGPPTATSPAVATEAAPEAALPFPSSADAAVAVERDERTPAPAPAAQETVRLQSLVTIRGNSHLRANETTPEMVTIMGSATVDGVVDGESVTVMGNVTVNGTVRGDLVCVLGQVTLGPGAEVRGEVVAVGGGLVADPTSRIRGEKVVITIPGIGGSFGGWLGEWFQDGMGKARILPHNHTWAWATAGIFVLLNLLFATMFRPAVLASARALETRPVLSAVNGALVFLFFPVLLILLLASVVGIVLMPVAGAALFFCWFIGTIGVYCFCGQQFGLQDRPVLAVLAGNVVFLLLFALPVLGLAVWSVTGVMGLGGAITALGNKRREAREARAAAVREQKARQQQMPPAAPPPPPFVPEVQATSGQATYMAPPAPVANPTNGGVEGFASTPAPAAAAAHAGSSTIFVPPYSGWTPPAGSNPEPAATLPPLPVDDAGSRAAFWPRLGAFAIDFFAVTIAVNYLNIAGILPFVLIAYHIAFWGWRSTTPGGIVFNLRVVRMDNRPMDYGVATVRALGGIFSLLPAGLGFIWASFDSEGQAWHDKLAGTNVISERRSTPLV